MVIKTCRRIRRPSDEAKILRLYHFDTDGCDRFFFIVCGWSAKKMSELQKPKFYSPQKISMMWFPNVPCWWLYFMVHPNRYGKETSV